MSRYPSNAVPLADNLIQAGSPHAAMSEYVMGEQTGALVWGHSKNTRHFVWSKPELAPYATITAVDTATFFAIGVAGSQAVNFQIPFRLTEGFTRYRVWAKIASDVQTFFGVRLFTDDLITAIATDTGSIVQYARMVYPIPMFGWNRSEATPAGGYKSGAIVLTHENPTIPADRCFSVFLQAYLHQPQNEQLTLSGSIKVYLVELAISEIADTEVGP